MSRDASITFEWADSEYTFRLAVAQLRELQEDKRVDAGPMWIYARLESGQWRVDDLIQTIRLGLIGGGMKPDEARTKVRRYVEGRPWSESIVPAQKILLASIVGAEDEPLKKVEGEVSPSSPSQTVSSGLPALSEMPS